MVHEGSRGFDVIFFFSRVLSEVCLRQLYPYPIRGVYICTSVCMFSLPRNKDMYYSLCPRKNAILAQCHSFVS
jgi:hypothetical protein